MLSKNKCIVLQLVSVFYFCLDTEFIEEGKKMVAMFIVTSEHVSLLFFCHGWIRCDIIKAPQNSMFVEQ